MAGRTKKGPLGRAFPITRKQVKGYGYARPNPSPVTTIVAVNGRGAYRKKKARSVMAGLSRTQRLEKARALTRGARRSAPRKGEGTMKKRGMRAARARIGAALRKNTKNPSPAQRRAREAFARMVKRRAQMRKNAFESGLPSFGIAGGAGDLPQVSKWARAEHTAAGLPSTRRVRKGVTARERARIKREAKSLGLEIQSRRRRKKSRKSATKKETPMKKAAKKRSRKAARKTAPASPVRRRRRKTTKKARSASTKKRTRRTKKQIAAARRNLKKARAARKGTPVRRRRRKSTRKVAATPRRRKTRRVARKGRRLTGKRLAAARRNLKKARAAKRSKVSRRKTRKTRKTSRKRSYRKNARLTKAARSRAAKKGWRRRTARKASRRASPRRTSRRRSSKRRMRRNSRRRMFRNFRLFKKNQGVMEMVRLAGLVTAGLVAHKAATALLNAFVLDPMLAPPVVVTEAPPVVATAPATSGVLGALPEGAKPIVRLLASAGLAGLGVAGVHALVSDQTTANALSAGMITSVLHSAVVAAVEMLSPTTAGYLAGVDSTAARLSAMYGLGASIGPRYQRLGEYFNEPMGEYFENGMSGLGNYIQNPEIAEAAAGYGAYGDAEGFTNNIDPNSNLERELTIAEAAAGVGSSAYEASAGFGASAYEASAGVGEYLTTMNGLGASIEDVPGGNTWIPSDAFSAGTRSVRNPQSATAMIPAGILETGGGAGIFG